MTPTTNDTQSSPLDQAEFQALLHEKLRQAIRLTLVTIMDEGVEAFIGAGPYQRTPWRRDHRNGFYTRSLGTSAGVIDDLAVPRTRRGFRTWLFKRYQRRQAELDEALGEMFVRGLSTQQVGQVIEILTETRPSPSTVSRVFHTLEGEFQAWKTRPLTAHYLYAFADGAYFTVIYEGKGHKPTQVLRLATPTVHQAQDGERPELHPEETARSAARTQGHFLPGDAGES